LRDNLLTRRAVNRAGGRAVIDARYPFAGSHHQKSAVLQVSGEAVAYCGGTDLAADRWDTSQHNSDPRRVRERYAAWHDVHARVSGLAVLDIEQNFRDRWNDRKRPSFFPFESAPPPITAPLPKVASSPGTQHVQVLRTFACKGAHYPSFAPAGEFSALAGYTKAIGRARRYIYIEDQYLYSDDIARELVAALPNIEKLIIVVPRSASRSIAAASQHYHQAQFIRDLRLSDAAKVHVYDLVQPSTGEMIYVHSKVLIIDDIYAAIGSMNVNRRSATHDSELVLAVVDGALDGGVCRFARDLRLNLWGEHLSLPATSSLIADPIAGTQEWERQATTNQARVRRHVPATPQRTDWRFRWVDPDSRCP
jgi:phosphatidylserine/phosphatidylglycerophosphate/cardiolipin synthase-like enzyme